MNMPPFATMSAYYVFCIGASGCLLPFFGKTLENNGFAPGQMSILLALLPISQFIFPPIWAAYADKYKKRQQLMGLSPICAMVFALLLALQPGLISILKMTPFSLNFLLILGFCIFFTPVIPLADANTNAAVGKDLEYFGKIRVWGSIAFATCAGGLGLVNISEKPQLQWLSVATAYGLAAIVSRFLPRKQQDIPPTQQILAEALEFEQIPFAKQVRQYFSKIDVVLIIVASTLYFFGHGAFEIFFSVHLGHLGFDDRFIGFAWFLGLCFEIALMLIVPAYIGKWSLKKTLAGCSLINSLRWLVIAFATSSTAILGIQLLHSLTFGVWYLALNMIVHRKTGPEFKAMTQISVAGSIAGGRLLSYILGPSIMHTHSGSGLFSVAAILSLAATTLYMSKKIYD